MSIIILMNTDQGLLCLEKKVYQLWQEMCIRDRSIWYPWADGQRPYKACLKCKQLREGKCGTAWKFSRACLLYTSCGNSKTTRMLAQKQPYIQRVRNSSLVESSCAENVRGWNTTPKPWTRNASGRGAFLKPTKLYRKEQWRDKKRECRNE